jgi:hypothetical protein
MAVDADVIAMSAEARIVRDDVPNAIATEQDLADMLDRLAEFGVVTMHHQRVRRSWTRIDHLAVAPSGVYVINARMWQGSIGLDVGGSTLRPKDRLRIDGHNRTHLATTLARKAGHVRRALGESVVPVYAALCFIGGDWPLWAKPIEIRDVTVMWPRELERRVVQLGRRERPEIELIASRLRTNLRAA